MSEFKKCDHGEKLNCLCTMFCDIEAMDYVKSQISKESVTIPRTQHEALMAAVPALERAQRTLSYSDTWAEGETDKMCQRALAALRAAGINLSE